LTSMGRVTRILLETIKSKSRSLKRSIDGRTTTKTRRFNGVMKMRRGNSPQRRFIYLANLHVPIMP
jgi:hypothetical protein